MTSKIANALALVLASASGVASANPLRDAVAADMPRLTAIYRHLHANPELSMQEVKTAALMAKEMKALGFEVTTGVGKTGVVAVMRNGPGKTLLIRTDMDGLPVPEQTGLPYASKVRATGDEGIESPVMHACGHDTHMASWLGTAKQLVAMKGQWSGTLVMIAQPAEERGTGARAMLEDGLFTRFPKPDASIAFHDSAAMLAGTIGYSDGYAYANVDSVDVLVKGVGGHGAMPQSTRDPIVLASRIVTALQTLVSRENNPFDPAVVTVGSFHAGAKHNIISDRADLLLTIRSFKPEVRNRLIEGVRRIARGEAIAAGLPEELMPVVTVKDEFTPSVYNTPALTNRLATLFTDRFGSARVSKISPTTGGEDFSRYWLADQGKEAMIFWVGGVPQAKWDAVKGDINALPSLHSPFWAPDAEAVIATATEAMSAAALDVLVK